MAEVNPNSTNVNRGLAFRSTQEILGIIAKSSLTSGFAVDIKKPNSDNISLLAYEAVLPGKSFQTSEVIGSVQGISEKYPIAITYPDVDISFYITREYNVLRFFESLMESISKTNGGKLNDYSFKKFNYPDDYKFNVNIIKYERDMRPRISRLTKTGKGVNPKTYTYSLIRAFPTNIISIPVSYAQSDILRTTITFSYDRYEVQENQGLLDTTTTRLNPTNPDQPPQTSQINPDYTRAVTERSPYGTDLTYFENVGADVGDLT